ncbi:MAG: hypothetical protein M1832_005402 [Thelocarpon impressellum]|nr:MAG: hypothetical protein M1832_005402 [Thelocarpon impressellum]
MARGSSLAVSISGSHKPSQALSASLENPEDPRNLILRAFVPHIAVQVSADTDEVSRQKGFQGGFRELLRPFGELVQGKVTVRDSIGASRSWEDFAVRFVGLGEGLGDPVAALREVTHADGKRSNGSAGDGGKPRSSGAGALRTGGQLGQVEALVEQHLNYSEMMSNHLAASDTDDGSQTTAGSPFYQLYLRRLLSGLPLSPHETFAHPVMCIIAISSRNASPIETLRHLYEESSRGEKRLPVWVSGEYLRYYVLVHDEEHDDIAKSTALFEAMKRHFGLHCHLLRLRSSRCVPSDDDSMRVPKCEWISAAEELAEMQKQGRIGQPSGVDALTEAADDSDELEDPTPYLVESDVTAIRTFVRQMVTQSVVPFMERCVMTWNEQVASRRRGISGRFMSLSKRWTSFGGTSRSSSASGPGGSNGPNSSFDAEQGFYRHESPEATMRKLADYAFMMRDWKLAQETYEMLRADFGGDKAWWHQAGANEMAAISTLLVGQPMAAKTRAETIEQMLDTASYSYLTRCSAPYNALRCLALAVELLRLRGGSAADDAARWGARILELKMVGRAGDALFTDRVAACYAVRKGVGSGEWGARRRKSSLWNMLAADAWLRQGKYSQAERALDAACREHGGLAQAEGRLPFRAMQAFLDELRHALQAGRPSATADEADEAATLVEEQSEKLGERSHRKSLIGAVGAAPFGGLDNGPLSPARMGQEESGAGKDDDFQ